MELELLEYVNKNLPKGFDPYWIYLIMVDHQEVGRIVLREGEDDARYFDGHIGYHIEPEYRGHHYSYQACLLLRDKIDRDHIIMTCDPHNTASRKIIERLGCNLIERKMIPKDLKHLFAKDEKEKLIYIWRFK